MEEAPQPQFTCLVKKGELNVVTWCVSDRTLEIMSAGTNEKKKWKNIWWPSLWGQVLWIQKVESHTVTGSAHLKPSQPGSTWMGRMVARASGPCWDNSFYVLFKNLGFLSILLGLKSGIKPFVSCDSCCQFTPILLVRTRVPYISQWAAEIVLIYMNLL